MGTASGLGCDALELPSFCVFNSYRQAPKQGFIAPESHRGTHGFGRGWVRGSESFHLQFTFTPHPCSILKWALPSRGRSGAEDPESAFRLRRGTGRTGRLSTNAVATSGSGLLARPSHTTGPSSNQSP